MALATKERQTNTESPPKTEPLVEEDIGVGHNSTASTSIKTTNKRCNDKDKHNIIYKPRENQQRHDGYYTIEGTVQHGQFVKSDMQMHCADKMMYAEEIVEHGYLKLKVKVTPTHLSGRGPTRQ